MFGFNFSAKKESSTSLETLLSAAAEYGVAKELEDTVKAKKVAEEIRDDLKARDALYGVIKKEQKETREILMDVKSIKDEMISKGRNPQALAQEAHNLEELKQELLGDIAELHGFARGAVFRNLKEKIDGIENNPLI